MKKSPKAVSMIILLLLAMSCLVSVMPAPTVAEPPQNAPLAYGPCDLYVDAPTLGHFWDCYYWLADPYSMIY
jgi:hypothetical protein